MLHILVAQVGDALNLLLADGHMAATMLGHHTGEDGPLTILVFCCYGF